MQGKILKDEIERAIAWYSGWGALVDGAAIDMTVRQHMSAAFQHLCLEHHVALIHLVQADIYGAAFALYRPQFDAFTRGAWVRACAPDDWIEGFRSGDKQPPNLKDLISDLERVEGYGDGFLSSFRDTAYGLLCDFTHGGAVQIQARVASGAIKQRWAEEHIAGLLRSSSALTYLACIEIAHLADDKTLANEFAVRHQRAYPASLIRNIPIEAVGG
ncbi:DUF6988 family protein [Burkholderia vietnamiensis]|uniref:DUF6988 family protein n=1 Tax=Burkholderia vietnamiensis TaxID=60552 RepID=UPI001BA23286|nr:hypothetical protein [Burkholderia vietnamiensis]MBR8005648.1 hypothetical protein [Burkholderia vietnamiensis]